MTRLFVTKSLSHSRLMTLRLAPIPSMNSRSASIVRPRRIMPCTVGKRGSYHPSTMP